MEHFIKNIEITNFKSIRHAEVKDCRRVNVFVGYPNVGKSNILEAMSILSYLQKFEINLSKLLRLKGYSELFYNGNINEVSTVTINDNSSIASLQYKTEKIADCTLKQLILIPSLSEMQLREVSRMRFSENNIENIPTKHPAYSEKKIRKYNFQNKYSNVRTDGTTLSSPEGVNLFDIVELNTETRNQVKQLFNNYNLKLTFDKNDNQIKLLKALEDDTFYLIPFHQIADTLQRLIFYKAAILSNKKTSLLFEEPESHMFPPYISQLTSDVIQDNNQNQFFIATQSPFVLNDFMEDLKDEELSIYAVGLENGETTINRMTDEQVTEAYQYGIDLFFNLENYLKPEELIKQ